MVFTPVVCLVFAVLGAYLMYCRQKELNPVNNTGFFIGREETFDEVSTKTKKDKQTGFYE